MFLVELILLRIYLFFYISRKTNLHKIFYAIRFQVCGNEYNVLLNKRDIDLYHYEIWKKDGDNLVFVDDVFLSLDKFREYYFADERSTNFKIINELIIPTIIKNDN